MQVRVGSSLCDHYDQEQGVPQGGVLSTPLFSINNNDIGLGKLTDCSFMLMTSVFVIAKKHGDD